MTCAVCHRTRPRDALTPADNAPDLLVCLALGPRTGCWLQTLRDDIADVLHRGAALHLEPDEVAVVAPGLRAVLGLEGER